MNFVMGMLAGFVIFLAGIAVGCVGTSALLQKDIEFEYEQARRERAA